KRQCSSQHRLKRFVYLLFFAAGGLSISMSSIAQRAPGSSDPSAFTARLVNLEATSKETFRYNAQLHNGTSQSRIYELNAGVPAGWNVAFKAEGSQVTSLKLDAGATKDVTIEINASHQVEPGK